VTGRDKQEKELPNIDPTTPGNQEIGGYSGIWIDDSVRDFSSDFSFESPSESTPSATGVNWDVVRADAQKSKDTDPTLEKKRNDDRNADILKAAQGASQKAGGDGSAQGDGKVITNENKDNPTGGTQHHPEVNQGKSMAAFTEKPFSITRAIPQRQFVDSNANLYAYYNGKKAKVSVNDKGQIEDLPDDAKGHEVEYKHEGGDVLNFGNDPGPDGEQTLRAQYLLPGSHDQILSEERQLKGDIEFDLFSEIKPGFGLGETNKIHNQNEYWTKNVRFKGPLYTPSRPDGPEMGAHPVRAELHRSQSPYVQSLQARRFNHKRSAIANYFVTLPGSSSNKILPDDNNNMSSSRGLPRNNPSPMIPVINNHMDWSKVRESPGFVSSKRQFRKQYDPMRAPERYHPYQPLSGGPVYTDMTAPRLMEEVIPF
jgi:hypothetical protein